ncbi:toll-like receptor Tollo [Paramacrobiotus metropolitanus]|uniref:toll-like receptor Tollo n=1 Tax=Paramacrobiotus metropolitanus TaxID=2943436 RepID=UPI0024455F4D|nr:toll-like receptor Tollo [Paramacrobiotus metropolitanus]XP_055333586.1 toll-like receptor Tollo [Paramacrobiotus metropolitanus]XP_055333587.1 toll-like receptor Tollo [Paramacrobiotus metropolitanus]XP_055333588.1 toll-like receptor Tollo [Paramacrobiotus metropolitanus]XP_055333589.1 toll-like receptor Tollo [Paramacrobiotus metropolitanus]XP_055333590.1 toll-like receptor Tollo [Paramacrobiotus metropolitanus]XP_055333591.1 toll-like receptor Tollo [Paramacrobiotus metropolitanus]XP_0
MSRRKGSPARCDMVAMIWLQLIIGLAVVRTQSTRVDYPYQCPEECHCQTTLRNGVFVECALLSIGLWSDFRAIQANFTQGLLIQCDARHLDSKLLEGAFAHLTDLEKLSLVDCAFTRIPKDAFAGLRNLKTLTISTRSPTAQMHIEPGALRRLEQLETLDLHRSNIAKFPAGELCALQRLKFLHLQDNSVNNLLQLGTSGACLTSLEAVYLDGNSVRTLESDVAEYLSPKLRTLSLSRNKLDSVSDSALARLEQLTELDLSLNQLESLSDGLLQHQTQLERLWLNGNQVKSLPVNAFVMLSQLRVLNLSQNALTNQWINGELVRNCLQLHSLDLSHNQLTHIDRSLLRNLLNLNQLHLHHNRIEWLEPQAFTYQHKMEQLDLSQNLLASVEDEALDGLFALSLLNMSINQLKSLPDGLLADAKKLTVLDVGHNQLQQLSSDVFSPVRALQWLGLSRNQLSALQPALLRNLIDLQVLDVSENRLKSLPAGLLNNKPNLKVVILSNNDVSEWREDIVDGSLTRLEDLQLDGNLLQTVGNWTAGKLSNLLRLNVSNNQISQLQLADLPRSLLHLDAHSNSIVQLSLASAASAHNYNELQLRHLDVSSNQITSVGPKDLPASLQVINLADNRIVNIERYTFYNKPRLAAVNLQRNRLEALDEYALKISPLEASEQLPEFHIGSNPFLCDCQMVYMKKMNSKNLKSYLRENPNIADLDSVECVEMRSKASRRMLDVPDDAFVCPYNEQCVPSCHCCDYAACDCKMTCPDNCTCYHDAKWERNIIDCSARQLDTIPLMVPMDSTDVFLDGNILTALPEHALIARSRLNALYLNHSQIQRIDNRTFNGLAHLKILHLHHNQLTVLRGYEFSQLESLEMLDLSWNDIHAIHPHTFTALNRLRMLNLAGNQLDALVTLPLPVNTVQLYLANNMWECWCNEEREKTLTEWLEKNTARIADMANMHCYDRSQYPALLRDMKKPRERCSSVEALTRETGQHTFPVVSESSNQVLLLVGSILGCVCVVAFVAVVVILRYRYEIQVRLHSRFRVRLCSSLSDEDEESSDYAYEKICDAFISYSDEDDPLVLGELAPRLEFGVPKYKLFLHYRDYPLGVRTPESIIQGVQLSRRTILILSENYLKREWAKMDYRLAHQQVFKDRKNKIIIVLVGNIQMKDLDVDLRMYLKSNPCLQWGEKMFWKKLYYALPDPEPVLEDHYSRTLSSVRNGHIYSYPITDL